MKPNLLNRFRQRVQGIGGLIRRVSGRAASVDQWKLAARAITAHAWPGRRRTARFVLVLSQGRTGSTLILRMLNATPGIHLSGENDRAFDHLKAFAGCFDRAQSNFHTDFFRLAWQVPCDQAAILAKLRAFALDLYNPRGRYKVVGFKEIRYGRPETDPDLAEDLAFFRGLFPTLRVIFSVRQTEDCAKSLWWAADPKASASTLERIRDSFQSYYDAHRDHCYWMPYEELKHGSAVLRGMFDFLGVPFTESAARELDIRMRE
ncbi:MAG TPA: sulfotransferase [Tepidisphaeraceae bacterium]